MSEPRTAAEWPNEEPKTRGAYVRAVHPYTRGRYPDGLVESVEPDTGSVSVRIGRGSTVYGPAIHWAPIARRPEWLERLELEREHAA